MFSWLKKIFEGEPSPTNTLAVVAERPNEGRGRKDPPRDLDLSSAVYVPLPAAPKSWEVDGRDEFHVDFKDPVLGPIIQANFKGHDLKVTQLAAEVPAERLAGPAGAYAAKSWRKIVIKRRKAGQLQAAARIQAEMLSQVGGHCTDTDRRRLNALLKQAAKQGLELDIAPVDVVTRAEETKFRVSSGSGWTLTDEAPIPKDDRLPQQYTEPHFLADGIVLVDGSGKAVDPPAASALRSLDGAGGLRAERGLEQDVYRSGSSPSGTHIALFSSDGHLHVYDQDLERTILRQLRSDHRVSEHFRTIDTDYWGEFKSQVRAVDVSIGAKRVLFTLADEAWCIAPDGDTVWGLRMPLNEGWERAVVRSDRVGASAEVHAALATLGLSLPVSPKEVKTAWKKLALKHHPDRNPGDPTATERMKALNDACAVLTGVEPESLSVDDSDTTFFRRTKPDLVFDLGYGMQASITIMTGTPQDWIYEASFTPEGGALLGSYSGKVVAVTPDGVPTHVYDVGSGVNRALRHQGYTYLLGHTRLWVVKDTALCAFIDVFREGRLVVAPNGFGLLQSRRLRWFALDGTELGQVETRDPIRLVRGGPDGAVVETRMDRVVVQGLVL